jgi:transcription initiation factor TFIID subunit 6
MPPILSCLVAKNLCADPNEDHWSVRLFSARLMSCICGKYSQTYETLQSRVTRTLFRAFLDPLKALTTHYGAIIGLSSLGPSVIKSLLIPNLKAYFQLIQPHLNSEEGSVRRMEAHKCFEALKVCFTLNLEKH